MAEYKHTIRIPVQPQQIFDFVSDVRNLPQYLPTTRDAQSQGGERVRVQGEAKGHRYDADGYLKCDPDAMRLTWGADEGYYSGWLQIEPQADQSNVTVCLDFKAYPGEGEGHQPSAEDIHAGIVSALESIRNAVERQGGKVESPAAT